jgi:hypothetical protein
MTATSDEQIKEFRGQCIGAANSPLAQLCTGALTGDAQARIRVTAIMAGQGDPGPGLCRPCQVPGHVCGATPGCPCCTATAIRELHEYPPG